MTVLPAGITISASAGGGPGLATPFTLQTISRAKARASALGVAVSARKEGRVVQNSGRSEGVTVSGNYVYLASTDDGLRIFDISKPAAPVAVGHVNEGGGQAYGVAVSGDFAYLANYADGLRIQLKDLDFESELRKALKPAKESPAGSKGVSLLFAPGAVSSTGVRETER